MSARPLLVVSLLAALIGGRSGEALAAPCGAVTATGCCSAERLWWCGPQGQLHTVDCAGRVACGWSNRGLYDCDTAGSADPSGGAPRACDFGDAGAPRASGIDAGPDAGVTAGACGELTEVGCCLGEVLVYCDRARPRAVACQRNLRCGWQASGQIYNCGTEGREDPDGVAPKACGPLPEIDLPPADLGGDGASGDGASGDGASGDGASGDGASGARADGGAGDLGAGDGAVPADADGPTAGCGCGAVGAGAAPTLLSLLSLLSLLLCRRPG